MKVLCLSLYPSGTAPNLRFRAEAYTPLLRDRGILVDYASFFSSAAYTSVRAGGKIAQAKQLVIGFVHVSKLLPKINNYDVVWLLREAAPIGPPVLEQIIARILGRPIVYDFDDAIWMPQNREHAVERMLRWRRKVSSIIRASAHVVAGNAFLGRYARNFNGKATIVPTSVDTRTRYARQRVHGPKQAPVIGWIGSHSTTGYLETIAPILSKLRRTHNFRIHIISDCRPTFRFPDFSFHHWSAQDEIDRLLEFDIGIMPLASTQWEAGKCGLKIIQYMALGIPPVASGVGVNAEIIRHGVDGYICNTDDEWHQALVTLLHDHELRGELGRSARARVEEHYSIRTHVDKLAAIFRTVANQRDFEICRTGKCDADEIARV
jgi:glycosyltransferase involved in cell wall biosynthesis